MKAKNTTLISTAVVLAIVGSIVAWVYKVGINRPPLVFADFHPSTINYLMKAASLAKDQGISFGKYGPLKWDNEEDLGQNDSFWSKEEDANVVVYYRRDKEAVWQTHAQEVQVLAASNIDRLIALMGHYHFPDLCNGRKLTIYLPPTETLYDSTIRDLQPKNSINHSSGTKAINVTEVGPLGCLSRGIVINPVCFETNPFDRESLSKTLAHEMCHYEFLASLDYGKEVHPYTWINEGIAEFFCNRNDKKQITGADSISFIQKNCRLNSEFPIADNASLWAGESFFLFLEKNYGISAVTQFIQTVESSPTDSIFLKLGMNEASLQEQWAGALLGKSIAIADSILVDSIAVEPIPNEDIEVDTLKVNK